MTRSRNQGTTLSPWNREGLVQTIFLAISGYFLWSYNPAVVLVFLPLTVALVIFLGMSARHRDRHGQGASWARTPMPRGKSGH